MRSLQELLSPFVTKPLGENKLCQLQLYLDLLLKWNARISLTAIRDPQEIVQRHFGESLFAAEQLQLDATSTLIDFGSGAGFPGLPIKIAAPHLEVTLIESQQKKVAFLREAIRTLQLDKTTVFAGRAEQSFLRSQIVTSRAVEKFEGALPAAASLVEPGGRLALLIGSNQTQLAAKTLPRFDWQAPIPVPASRARVIYMGQG